MALKQEQKQKSSRKALNDWLHKAREVWQVLKADKERTESLEIFLSSHPAPQGAPPLFNDPGPSASTVEHILGILDYLKRLERALRALLHGVCPPAGCSSRKTKFYCCFGSERKDELHHTKDCVGKDAHAAFMQESPAAHAAPAALDILDPIQLGNQPPAQQLAQSHTEGLVQAANSFGLSHGLPDAAPAGASARADPFSGFSIAAPSSVFAQASHESSDASSLRLRPVSGMTGGNMFDPLMLQDLSVMGDGMSFEDPSAIDLFPLQGIIGTAATLDQLHMPPPGIDVSVYIMPPIVVAVSDPAVHRMLEGWTIGAFRLSIAHIYTQERTLLCGLSRRGREVQLSDVATIRIVRDVLLQPPTMYLYPDPQWGAVAVSFSPNVERRFDGDQGRDDPSRKRKALNYGDAPNTAAQDSAVGPFGQSAPGGAVMSEVPPALGQLLAGLKAAGVVRSSKGNGPSLELNVFPEPSVPSSEAVRKILHSASAVLLAFRATAIAASSPDAIAMALPWLQAIRDNVPTLPIFLVGHSDTILTPAACNAVSAALSAVLDLQAFPMVARCTQVAGIPCEGGLAFFAVDLTAESPDVEQIVQALEQIVPQQNQQSIREEKSTTQPLQPTAACNAMADAGRRVSRPTSRPAKPMRKNVYAEDFLCDASAEMLRAVVDKSYSDGTDIASAARPAAVAPGDMQTPESNRLLERLLGTPSCNNSWLLPRRKRATGVPRTRKRDPAYPMDAMKGAEGMAVAGQVKLMDFVRRREGFTAAHVVGYYAIPGKTPEDVVYRTPLHLAAEKNLGDVVAALIAQYGVSPDVVDSQGCTPLVLAAAQGCMQAAKALLGAGADLNLAAADGRLPLHEAILFGHYAIAELLLMSTKMSVNVRIQDQPPVLLTVLDTKAGPDLLACVRLLCAFGPDLNLKSNGVPPKIGPESAFDICLRKHLRNPEIFGIVTNTKSPIQVQSAVIDAVDLQHRSIIFRCLEARCYDAVRGLLFLGADPSIVPMARPGKPPPDNCLLTCIRAGHLDIGRAVMQAIMEGTNGANSSHLLSVPDFQGYHPALLAARRTDPLEVRHWIDLLIKYEIELHTITTPPPPKEEAKTGATAGSSLMLELVRRGHVEAAMHLWDYLGANVNVAERDGHGRSLVFYACYRFKKNDRTILLQRLLQNGAPAEQPDNTGITPLMAACRAGHYRACLMLINKDENPGDPLLTWSADPSYQGVSINCTDQTGNTPLWYATLMENPVLVDLLLRNGASVNERCYRGRTALILAVRSSEHRKTDMFEVLMHHGADPTIKDDKNNSAVDYAFMKEFEYNCRPMTNYFKRTCGLNLRDTLESLKALEDTSADLPNKGWGRPSEFIKTLVLLFTSPGKLFSGQDKEPDLVKKAYLIAFKQVKPDKKLTGMRAEAVFEGGKEIVKAEAKKQSIAAAKELAVFAVKAGAAAGAAYVGVDASTVLDVIDVVEDTIETAREIMEAFQRSMNFVRMLNDGDYEGSGRRHDPSKYACPTYEAFQRLMHAGFPPKMFTLYSGPKELKNPGPNYKHKPHRFRPGERVTAFLEGIEYIILRDYGSKEDRGLPYLAGCTCKEHEDEPCEMRRFAKDELISLDYPLQDKSIKGELELSVRHDDVQDRLVITPHVLAAVKDGKKDFSVRVKLKRAKTLNAAGEPQSVDSLTSLATDDKTWTESARVLELFHLMNDDLPGETLYVEVYSASKGNPSFLGGVAINLDGLDVKPVDHQTYTLAKDYREFAVGVEEHAEDEAVEGVSTYGFTAQLPQELVAFIDRYMAVGPPTFAADLFDWRPLCERVRLAWIDRARNLPSDCKPLEATMEKLFKALLAKFTKMDRARLADEAKVRRSAAVDKLLQAASMAKSASQMALKAHTGVIRSMGKPSQSRASVSEESMLERHREAHEAASTIIVQDSLHRQYFYACRVARKRCANLVEMRALLVKYNKEAKIMLAQSLRLCGTPQAQMEEMRNCYKGNTGAINELFAGAVPTADLFVRAQYLEAWKAEEKALFALAFSGKDSGTWSFDDGQTEATALPEFMTAHLRKMCSSPVLSLPPSPIKQPSVAAWAEETPDEPENPLGDESRNDVFGFKSPSPPMSASMSPVQRLPALPPPTPVVKMRCPPPPIIPDDPPAIPPARSAPPLVRPTSAKPPPLASPARRW
eukprot:m.216433 g.216433  ORF g.216433 m.216433 type:complete len:2158 (-) comp10153_c1_seq10:1380-7853(-)